MRKILILIIMSLFSFVSIGNAEVNFAGKTVTWVVPFKEGGGTSRFARFIQPFLTKCIYLVIQIFKLCTYQVEEQLKVQTIFKKMQSLMEHLFLDVQLQ